MHLIGGWPGSGGQHGHFGWGDAPKGRCATLMLTHQHYLDTHERCPPNCTPPARLPLSNAWRELVQTAAATEWTLLSGPSSAQTPLNTPHVSVNTPAWLPAVSTLVSAAPAHPTLVRTCSPGRQRADAQTTAAARPAL